MNSGDREPLRIRGGFSLAELSISLVGASLLIIGLSSAIFIALKATDTSQTPTDATIEGNVALTELVADVEFATSFIEKTTTATTFTVPDRNGDASPETIRYAWSGTAGDPLTRQHNGGTIVNLIADVHDFGFEYFEPSTNVEIVTAWIRVSNNTQASIETSIPVLNRP